MATAVKILGQAAPAATTETDLYAVPEATEATLSTIVVCNRSATPTTFRISCSFVGGGTANKDYIAYDVPIAGNDTVPLTIGITLGATDTVRVYAGAATLSFTAFGAQKT
ncbi:MAG: hypothetical protein FJ296_00720 [Planctomycetes bacterium]|nr:hypothetical protein [Planctomycetota bacterium]